MSLLLTLLLTSIVDFKQIKTGWDKAVFIVEVFFCEKCDPKLFSEI